MCLFTVRMVCAGPLFNDYSSTGYSLLIKKENLIQVQTLPSNSMAITNLTMILFRIDVNGNGNVVVDVAICKIPHF